MVVCCAETVILGTKRRLFLPKVPSFTHLAIYKRVARLYATLGTGSLGKEFYDRYDPDELLRSLGMDEDAMLADVGKLLK